MGRSAWAIRYAYCGGDPVNRSDPSGLDWTWDGADWEWIPESDTFMGRKTIQRGDYNSGYFDPPTWDGSNGELITVRDLTNVRNAFGGHVGGASQRQYDQFYVDLIGQFGKFDGAGTLLGGISTAPGAQDAFREFHGVMSMPEVDIRARRSSAMFDDIQGWAEVAGQIPVVGEPVDLANALVYALRGKSADALMSSGSAIPAVGNFVGGGKLVAKNADEAAALLRIGGEKRGQAPILSVVSTTYGAGVLARPS